MQHTDALVEAHQAAQAIAHQRASDSADVQAAAETLLAAGEG